MKKHLIKNACWIAVAGCTALLSGCADKNNVLAVTGTVIGVQIHEKDADKTPEVKIGYARTEIAYVPTDKGTTNSNASAANSAEVLMEINAQGSVGLGTAYQGGVYQRLAVGRTAVSQPGAAFMMAKDSSGSLDAGTAAAVQRATSTVTNIPAPEIDITAEKEKMGVAFTNGNSTVQGNWEAAAVEAGYPITGNHPDHPAFRNFEGETTTTTNQLTAVSNAAKKRQLTW